VGGGSCSWVLHRMAGVDASCSGRVVAGMTVARPFGSLYSITGLSPGVVLPGCLKM
jgi:hypothetical protein